tara:strand:+ start:112 stop:414 length:303 start_codon:yes stop_codon:yes gene_type:complete
VGLLAYLDPIREGAEEVVMVFQLPGPPAEDLVTVLPCLPLRVNLAGATLEVLVVREVQEGEEELMKLVFLLPLIVPSFQQDNTTEAVVVRDSMLLHFMGP